MFHQIQTPKDKGEPGAILLRWCSTTAQVSKIKNSDKLNPTRLSLQSPNFPLQTMEKTFRLCSVANRNQQKTHRIINCLLCSCCPPLSCHLQNTLPVHKLKVCLHKGYLKMDCLHKDRHPQDCLHKDCQPRDYLHKDCHPLYGDSNYKTTHRQLKTEINALRRGATQGLQIEFNKTFTLEKTFHVIKEHDHTNCIVLINVLTNNARRRQSVVSNNKLLGCFLLRPAHQTLSSWHVLLPNAFQQWNTTRIPRLFVSRKE